MRFIAEKIDQVLQAPDNEAVITAVKGEVHEKMKHFPLQYDLVPNLEHY
jgi:glycine/serine hydroxymethyltransferase